MSIADVSIVKWAPHQSKICRGDNQPIAKLKNWITPFFDMALYMGRGRRNGTVYAVTFVR